MNEEALERRRPCPQGLPLHSASDVFAPTILSILFILSNLLTADPAQSEESRQD